MIFFGWSIIKIGLVGSYVWLDMDIIYGFISNVFIYFEIWFEVIVYFLYRDILGDLKMKCRGNMFGIIDDRYIDNVING